MACGTCALGSCGVGGCGSKGGCSTGGCNKRNAFDWLRNMDLPASQRFNIVEVKFKGGRKAFYRNDKQMDLYTGDPVILEVQNGHHMGHVSLQGDIVRLQMQRRRQREDEDMPSILRKATEKDLEKFAFVRNREMPTLYRTREIVEQLGLKMKLSDVEYQADNTKATFFYSADDRVDFRELIKILAGEFKIRVEMRQISLRQEASRLGGIGSCGRELCCSTWLTEFKSVSTAAARYQNLSLNPSKLSGQCGRLKCCLNYELETYIDALVDIPVLDKPLKTARGNAYLQKVDIFKKYLWFSYAEETTWYSISAEQVKVLQELNKKGIVIEDLNMSPDELNAIAKRANIRLSESVISMAESLRMEQQQADEDAKDDFVSNVSRNISNQKRGSGNGNNNTNKKRKGGKDEQPRFRREEGREAREPREGREPRENREPREGRESRKDERRRDGRPDNRQGRGRDQQPREGREKDPQQREQQPREPRENRREEGNREGRQPRENREQQISRSQQTSEGQGPRQRQDVIGRIRKEEQEGETSRRFPERQRPVQEGDQPQQPNQAQGQAGERGDRQKRNNNKKRRFGNNKKRDDNGPQGQA